MKVKIPKLINGLKDGQALGDGVTSASIIAESSSCEKTRE